MWSHDFPHDSSFETGFLLKFVLICLFRILLKMSTCKFGNYLNLAGLLAFSELNAAIYTLTIVAIYSEYAEKTPQHFNGSICLLLCCCHCFFLTIDARMRCVMKRSVLQTPRSSLQAHYSSIGGPARGLKIS